VPPCPGIAAENNTTGASSVSFVTSGAHVAASIVSDDAPWTVSFIRDAAPWHGRLHILDTTTAAQTTGHGSPLPALKHGGPGRAGGGSELAGLRGVVELMQRTAVQTSPELLAALGANQLPR